MRVPGDPSTDSEISRAPIPEGSSTWAALPSFETRPLQVRFTTSEIDLAGASVRLGGLSGGVTEGRCSTRPEWVLTLAGIRIKLGKAAREATESVLGSQPHDVLTASPSLLAEAQSECMSSLEGLHQLERGLGAPSSWV